MQSLVERASERQLSLIFSHCLWHWRLFAALAVLPFPNRDRSCNTFSQMHHIMIRKIAMAACM